MNDDAVLLRRYTEEGSESAFTELVHRHVDLVYGAALRRTGGNAHCAADVAQHVFSALARNARKLSRHAVLGAWLHTATRNAALNLMISEERRQVRERAALDPALADGDAGVAWDRLRPILDAAIDELSEVDRSAVVLRFLERKPFSEIGRVLRITENAARMRTDRALDKLRAALARRGITSASAALGAVVSSQSLVSAPAGLAATLSSQSLVAAVGTSAGLFATFTAIMSTKIIATAAVSAAVFFALGAYFGLDYTTSQPLPPPPELPAQTQKIASLREQNERLRAEVDRLTAANASLSARPAALPPAPAPSPGLSSAADFQAISQRKAMMNNLRQIAAARDQFQLENGRPPASLDELVGETKYIRRLNPVAGESYTGLSLMPGQPLSVMTPNGASVTYDPSGSTTDIQPPPPTPEMARFQELARRLTPSIRSALDAYRAAHNGDTPSNTNPEALLPYFATPQEGADFAEIIAAQKALGR